MKKGILLIITLFVVVASHGQMATKKTGHPTLPMSDMAVESIVTAMKNSRSDYLKLQVMRNGMQNNTDGITIKQQLKMLNQLATDSSKLECAKFLYPWSVDYKDYTKLQYNMSTPEGQKAMKVFAASKGSK